MIFILQERCNRREIILLLPGSEIPRWFINQSPGSEIILQLPQHCCQSLIGFAFCAVASVCRSLELFKVSCMFSIEITLSGRKHVLRDCNFIVCPNETDHVILGFHPSGNVGFLDDNHHTTVSFWFYSTSNVVKCCGVCPVCANPSVTKPNTFTLNFATHNLEIG